MLLVFYPNHVIEILLVIKRYKGRRVARKFFVGDAPLSFLNFVTFSCNLIIILNLIKRASKLRFRLCVFASLVDLILGDL